VVGIPVLPSAWPSLFVDIEASLASLEGEGIVDLKPGPPCFFISWDKDLAEGKQFVPCVILGPDERVKRCPGH